MDDSYWKLVDGERHFNTIEAGIRALASGWLLVTFGAVAVLLKKSETSTYFVPAEWLNVAVCVMGATGLALLWVVDQLVYHRLLNGAFLIGLKLEYDDPRIPPMHASMMMSSEGRGMARLLALFYAGPIAALSATAIAVAVYHWVTLDEAVTGRTGAELAGLFALALVPVVYLVIMWRKQPEARLAERAKEFGDPGFFEVVDRRNYAALLARYEGPTPAAQKSP